MKSFDTVQNKAGYYAEALYEVLSETEEGDVDAILNNFFAVLSSKGHSALLPNIVREYIQIAGREKNKRSTLVVSNEKGKSEFREKATEFNIPDSSLDIVVDESLVGGFRLEGNDVLVDGSYKRMLLELYRSFVS
jgi:F0F1-type ATP synthase delta subunit|tara:strand:+ start:26809 stop:27213 length:405 start_codon:yes stop_codon:yes gene_type:complete